MIRRALTWQKAALGDLKDVERRTAERIVEAVRRFSDTGESNNVKALAGRPHGGTHRLRVGEWRVIILLAGDIMVVLRVLKRRDAY